VWDGAGDGVLRADGDARDAGLDLVEPPVVQPPLVELPVVGPPTVRRAAVNLVDTTASAMTFACP